MIRRPFVQALPAATWASRVVLGALLLGAAVPAAEAVDIGHASVTSAPGQPLRVVIPLTGVDAGDGTLQVTLADTEAWSRAGVPLPMPRNDLTLQLGQGWSPTTRTVYVYGTQAPQDDSVNLLLDIQTGSQHSQVQVSVLTGQAVGQVMAPAAPAPSSMPPSASTPSTTTPAPAPTSASSSTNHATAGSIHIKRGDTLYALAGARRPADVSIYQALVAFWQANPQAFRQENMNFMLAGKNLNVPDAAAMRAIDPAQARQIFLTQLKAYENYRARLSGHSRRAQTAGGRANAGHIDRQGAKGGAGATGGDHLELSGGHGTATGSDQSDAQTSQNKAMEAEQARIDALNKNVDALKKADGQSGGASGTTGAAAGSTAGAAGAAGTTGAAGTSGANGAAGTASTNGAAGAGTAAGSTSGTTTGAAASDTAQTPANGDGLPAWLSGHALAVVTVVLAIIVLIVAWLMRRAGARREDDMEDDVATPVDDASIKRRLDDIDLNLDPNQKKEPGGLNS